MSEDRAFVVMFANGTTRWVVEMADGTQHWMEPYADDEMGKLWRELWFKAAARVAKRHDVQKNPFEEAERGRDEDGG